MNDDFRLYDKSPTSGTHLAVLTWLFTLFNSVRVLAYLPTLLAVFNSGDSSQHSLLTWLHLGGSQRDDGGLAVRAQRTPPEPRHCGQRLQFTDVPCHVDPHRGLPPMTPYTGSGCDGAGVPT